MSSSAPPKSHSQSAKVSIAIADEHEGRAARSPNGFQSNPPDVVSVSGYPKGSGEAFAERNIVW